MLDKIDRRILQCLRDDGRLSLQALADAVGLSASPCSRRLKALEEAGHIQGYCALINEHKIGFTVSVFVSVQLDRQIDDALERFEAAVRSFPEVVDCWLMTGSRDYLMRVVTLDLADFERFLSKKLTKVSGVATIESSIPLRQVKNDICRAPEV
ncbi:MAG: Lrp/AsnC family transcriptional regulator [Pseudomonadota bacterium]